MADNFVTDPGSGGDTFAADDIGGVKHQRVKVEFGPDGSAVDASTANPLPVDASGSTVTVSGTVSVSGSSVTLKAGSAQIGTVHGSSVSVSNSSGGGAVPIRDGGNSITVDGTVTANAGTGTFDVSGSTVTLAAGTANIGTVHGSSVTVANSSGAGAVPIRDGGNAITVDGTVTANAGSGTFNVSGTVHGSSVSVSNSSGAGAVPIRDGGNAITVDGTVTANAGSGTFNISGTVHGSSVSISNSSGGGAVPIRDGGNSITVDGSVDASGSTVTVSGQAAHDAAVAGNPLAVGWRANLNEPSAVGDGDAVWGWADRFGRLVVMDGHPNPESPVSVNITTSGASTIVGAPGAGLSLYVQAVSVSNASTSSVEVDLRPDSTNPAWKANLAGGGGGFANIDFGARGWRVGGNRSLRAALPSGGGDVHVNVQRYYIAAT